MLLSYNKAEFNCTAVMQGAHQSDRCTNEQMNGCVDLCWERGYRRNRSQVRILICYLSLHCSIIPRSNTFNETVRSLGNSSGNCGTRTSTPGQSLLRDNHPKHA